MLSFFDRFNVCYHTFEWSSLKLIALAACLGVSSAPVPVRSLGGQ